MTSNINPLGRSFYQDVMSFDARGVFPSQAVRRGEGLFFNKTYTLKSGEKLGLKDFMRVLLETDAGDSDEQRRGFYKKHLKGLNASELSRLMKKIHKIASGLMEDSEEKEVMEKLAETIRPILLKSEKLSNALYQKILKQLKKFPGLRVTGNELTFQRKRYTFQGFIKEYFSEITSEYDDLVEEGDIIPNRSEKLGATFVKNAIKMNTSK